MRRHGITFRTAGMMAVFQQTGRDTGRHGAHFGAVAIHGIEQCPLSIVLIIRLGGHKGPTIAECVKTPDAAAVIFTKPVHPAEDMGLQQYPLRDTAKVLRPEMKSLCIRQQSSGDESRVVSIGGRVQTGGVTHGMFLMKDNH